MPLLLGPLFGVVLTAGFQSPGLLPLLALHPQNPS